jgi:hypothetical protein
VRYVISPLMERALLLASQAAAKNNKKPHIGENSLSQRSLVSCPAHWAGQFALLLIVFCLLTEMAHAKTAVKTSVKTPGPRTAMGGFVKDRALARVLGETLFRDTVEVMSVYPVSVAATAVDSGNREPSHDNSAVGQVARTLLVHEPLDKYLWLIRHAYDDTLWRGGDRVRIEQHFALIWRTAIMLYESSLDANPTRVRVCEPGDAQDSFDCRDEFQRARVVPIPSQMPLVGHSGQSNTG